MAENAQEVGFSDLKVQITKLEEGKLENLPISTWRTKDDLKDKSKSKLAYWRSVTIFHYHVKFWNWWQFSCLYKLKHLRQSEWSLKNKFLTIFRHGPFI